MKDFTTYLSTAPVLIIIVASALSGLIIEINRFYPDPLNF